MVGPEPTSAELHAEFSRLSSFVSGRLSRRRFLVMASAYMAGAISLDYLLAACALPGSTPTKATSTVDTSNFVIGTAGLAGENFAPWLATGDIEWLARVVGETLVRNNVDTRVPEPGLATSWSVSSDLLTWTFNLRPNIPFHGGWGTVTADDVEFSWSQWLRPDSLLLQLRSAVGGDMSGFEIVSPLQFRVHAKAPVINLPSLLGQAEVGLPIISKKWWNSLGDAAASQMLMGTGPYQWVSHTPGSQVVLKAVDNHWRKTPAFKQVTIKIIPDDASRLAQVASKEVDLAAMPLTLKAEALADNLRVVSIGGTATASLFFGGLFPGDPKFNDPSAPWVQSDNPAKGLAIRQALNTAIDRKSILDKILLGEGSLTAAPFCFTPGAPFSDPAWKVPTYDPAKAKSLLAQGGYPNGFTIGFPIYADNHVADGVAFGEAMAGMFEAIGITVHRMPVNFSTQFLPQAKARATKGLIYHHSLSTHDEPLTILSLVGVPTSSVEYMSDPAITTYVTQYGSQPDQQKRFAAAKQVGTALIQDTAGIPFAGVNNAFVVGAKFGGWQPITGFGELHNLEDIQPA